MLLIIRPAMVPAVHLLLTRRMWRTRSVMIVLPGDIRPDCCPTDTTSSYRQRTKLSMASLLKTCCEWTPNLSCLLQLGKPEQQLSWTVLALEGIVSHPATLLTTERIFSQSLALCTNGVLRALQGKHPDWQLLCRDFVAGVFHVPLPRTCSRCSSGRQRGVAVTNLTVHG